MWVLRYVVAGLLLAVAIGVLFTWWEAGVIARRFPAKGAYTDVGGVRIHYTERLPMGTPRRTIVLLHGASGNQADVMLPLGDKLAALGFRVIAPDRPGHGWSDRPDGAADASPARQAVLLRQALGSIGVDRAIVVGHSWSGALAAEFAVDQPGFTDGLVLLSPVLYPWSTGIAWYYGPVTTPVVGTAFVNLLTLPMGLLLMPAGVAEVFNPQPAPPDFIARSGVELVLRPSEFVANAEDVSGLLSFVTEQSPHWREIGEPTAIVVGDGDRVVSPRIHALHAAKEIPGATLMLLKSVGHSPHWADPDAVVAAIVSVSDRIDAKLRAASRGLVSSPP